jgi:long-subunit acyl-CoA synthetase (AMP-forming)
MLASPARRGFCVSVKTSLHKFTQTSSLSPTQQQQQLQQQRRLGQATRRSILLIICLAGTPKGVMITHSALVATIAGCNQYLASFNETLGPEDSYLSFLPLAHVFDR